VFSAAPASFISFPVRLGQFFPRLCQAISLEGSDDGGGCAARSGAAVLLGARCGDRTPAHGQWQRILRSSGGASLRAISGDSANPASTYGHRLAGNQWLLRTISPHGEGRVLRRGFPQDVTNHSNSCSATSMSISRFATASALTRAIAAKAARLSKPGQKGLNNASRGGETGGRLG
jgi:hypothetical protein